MSATSRALQSLPVVLMALPAAAQDFVVPSGTQVIYDTNLGTLRVDNLIIEPGATLFVRGSDSFRVLARQSVSIDGELNLSGASSFGVGTLNTTNIPEVGAAGGPAGGAGGIGSRLVNASTPNGSPGVGTGAQLRGGRGGETAFRDGGTSASRRAAGGGGGALGPDQPVANDLSAPENIGLVAFAGQDGSPLATGAISMSSPPLGGAPGRTPFLDGNASNDFFGRKRAGGGNIIVGELAAPIAGRGGGAGGDAVSSPVFLGVPFTVSGDEKGAGGGGGGGLGIVIAPLITVGPTGEIHVDGGDGGGGENTNFLDRIGGGSGGGSGGMLILQARRVDLSSAGADSITAIGGRGGPGANNDFDATGAGGNGGPGLLQIHVPRRNFDLLLPPGRSLEELTSPDASVLLPEPGL